MIETYYLNDKTLPTIPVPHDCVIKNVSIDNQYIIFKFEDDISYHDSIKYIRPDAKSLIVRYHMVVEDSFSVYKWNKPKKFMLKNGYYECLDNSSIVNFSSGNLEYLYHNVGYCSVITKLFEKGFILLDAEVDFIEFEWIE